MKVQKQEKRAEKSPSARRQSAPFEIFQKSVQEIHAGLNLATVLKQVLRYGIKLSRMESGWILLWNEEEECLITKMVMNAPDALIGKKLKVGEDLPGRAMQEQRTVIAGRYGPGSVLFSGPLAGLVGTFVAVPLIRQEKAIGILCVGAKEPDKFLPKETQDLIDSFSRHAALAIVNAATFHSLQLLNEELEQKMEGITQESNSLREEMLRKGKLAALGQIVGSVNHELRQPLEVITNAVYYLKTQLERNDIGPIKKDFERFLNIISEECVNTTDLVNELLNFTRKKEIVPHGVDLNQLLESILQKIEIPHKVRVKKQFDPDLPLVYADPAQLSRGFYNILLNGIQAMPKGGVLQVSTESSGESVSLTIQDSGIGISPEHMKKIFEPLFTTKSKGIGLGLSLVKEYIEANQGQMKIQSKEGIGTTFRVSFPSMPAAEAHRH